MNARSFSFVCVIGLALGSAGLILAAGPPAATPNQASADRTDMANGIDPITFRAALSHSFYGASDPGEVLLKVDYSAVVPGPSARPPLNIALVIDCSGSMVEEKKFSYALDAAREIVRNLSAQDIVSLVAFNDRALVLSPAGKAVNSAFLLHRLEEISPGGYTDVSAGLLEGIAQINSKGADGQIKQVLFLTDGNANRGVTDVTGLRRIAEKGRAKGIRFSTLGVGTDFNEKLLAELAKAGDGRYIYARAAEQIPTAFVEELHGLLAVVAQNARIEIAVKGGSISRIYGQLRDPAAIGRIYTIYLGGVRAGESGTVLLAIKPADFQPGGVVEVTTALTLDDPQTSERVQRVAANRAEFTPSWRNDPAQQNTEVRLYATVLGAVETAQEAEEGYDLQRYNQVRQEFERTYAPAHQHALATRNQDLLNQLFLLKHFMEELEAVRTQGALHAHDGERRSFQKESDYQRYLLFHHRAGAGQPGAEGVHR